MARRAWVVDIADRRHRVELEHNQWSGVRRIRVDGEVAHESRRLFDWGHSKHPVTIDLREFAVVIRTNGVTYDYRLLRDDPAADQGTELTPAQTGGGRGDEPSPATNRSGVENELSADGSELCSLHDAEPQNATVVIREHERPDRVPGKADAGSLFEGVVSVLAPAVLVALIGAALGLPDAGALLRGLVAGTAGAVTGRRRGDAAGGETLFTVIGGLLGAALGLSLGAGVFGLLTVVMLCLLLLAPLPESTPH